MAEMAMQLYDSQLRMKNLVQVSKEMIHKTDFTDPPSVLAVLTFVMDAFLEIRKCIEREESLVMDCTKLLRSLRVIDPNAMNVRKNIPVNKVIALIQEGLYSTSLETFDFKSYSLKLISAINYFHDKLLLCLEQPQMIECFALNEVSEALESIPTDKENTILEKQFSDLPCLVTDKIFGYLDQRDLGRCAQVCKSWNSMVFHPALWRKIRPVMWARGMWDDNKTRGPRVRNRIRPWFHAYPLHGLYILTPSASEICVPPIYSKKFRIYKAELRIFSGLVQYVFPRVGGAVKTLDLGSSYTLDDQVLNIMLMQCPNVEDLDVSNTSLSTNAFLGIHEVGSCRRLKNLSLDGCFEIDNSSLLQLIKCWEDKNDTSNSDSSNLKSILRIPIIKVHESDLLQYIKPLHNTESCKTKDCEIQFIEIPFHRNSESFEVSGLSSLNFSCCHRLSDRTLKELLKMKGVLANLESLELSGCFNISGEILSRLVSLCPKLEPENLSYCDHIREGPYCNEANGCSNLQSDVRACCIHLK